MQLDIGSRVDRYTLVEKLGEGGMAVVFRVEHATLGTPHALKVLTMGGRQVKDRLVQEGRVQATLQHPHIVSVTDVLDIDGAPGLLMEYVDGPSLDDWLNKYRPTVEESVTLFRGIVAGVGLAHERGLIHRDLKPGNVMLHVTSTGVVPKVCDFGLAKVTDGGGDLKRTRTGMTMGTPAYMAPEQIRDSSTVDRRADLYSLGCILYELLCGKTPFEGDDMLSLFAAIAMGEYTPIQELVPEVPDAVAAVVEALLVDDVSGRLTDCASIFDLLDGRDDKATAFFPADGELGPPAPIGSIGRSVLDLQSAAADVARSMTRGVQMPDEISQVGWTSTVNSGSSIPAQPRSAAVTASATTADTTSTMATSESAYDEDTSLVIPVGTKAAGVAVLGGAGVLVFTGAVLLSIGVTWFLLSQTSAQPSATDPTEPVVEPAPVVEPVADPVPVEPSPPVQPEPTPVPVAAPDPAPVASPAPAVVPDPEPVAVPDPEPVAVPDPEPVAVPDPEPVAPDPVPEPAVATGSFRFSGATKVELFTANAVYAAGAPVPPGRYRVRVDGIDGGSSVTIRAGATASLTCVAVMGTCRSR